MTHTTLDAKAPTLYRRAAVFLLVLVAFLAYMIVPDSRMFWPYMLSAYFIGILIYIRELEKLPPGKTLSLWDYLFPREIWFHQSTFHDAIIALVNFALIAWVFDYMTFSTETIGTTIKNILGSASFEKIKLALETGPTAGTWPVIFYTMASLMLSELFYYISHRLTHTVPALWEFHKVHHSAEVMTPLTVYRMHPLDMWFNMICRNFGLGLAAGIFLYLYPSITSVMTIAGVNIGIFITNILGANLRHSHIWMRFGRHIEHFVVSPAQHQIHHSTDPRHFNKNYGSFLSIWDWAFNSLYIPKNDEKIKFGLGQYKDGLHCDPVWKMFTAPFKQFAKKRF